MIAISRCATNALKDKNGNIDFSLRKCWKKSKMATIWVVLYMIVEIPFVWLKILLMIICFIPHAIYDVLDDLEF